MLISNLPNKENKEFRTIIIKMLNELRRRIAKYREKFNKGLENKKKS